MTDSIPPAPRPPVTTERKDAEAVAPSRHDTGEVPVTVGEMRKAFTKNEIFTVLVAITAAAIGLLGAYEVFLSKAAQAGERKAAEVSKRMDGIELDMRELYHAFMYGKRSERLERPPMSKGDAGP